MPNTGVGLLTSFGTAEESTYGTAVTPDRWQEIVSESLERQNTILQSSGLRSGTIHSRRASRRVISAQQGTGSFTLEVPTTGFGRLLKHALGSSPTPVQQGGTAAYLQTHNLGSNAGRSLTLQKVIRDGANNVVQQFTHTGAKILAVEFGISVDQLLLATFTVDSRREEVSTAAAAPTYASNKPFHFAQVSALTLGGVAVAKVTNANWRVERPQKTDNFYLGSAGLKSEPIENDWPSVTGSLTAEFDSANKTQIYDAFAADTGLNLTLTFTGAQISGAHYETITFSIPSIHFTGETPKVGGPGITTMTAPFEGAWDGTNQDIIVNYISIDTTV
jgi:hypothetical protein